MTDRAGDATEEKLAIDSDLSSKLKRPCDEPLRTDFDDILVSANMHSFS